MVGIALSYTTIGIDAQQISVESDGHNGLYGVNVVGMVSSSVKESKDLVFATLKNAGYETPPKRYTIDLASADMKKDSTFSLCAIAIAIAVFSNFCPYLLISYSYRSLCYLHKGI